MANTGNDTATNIVNNDTLSLINQADNIVKSCYGKKSCNVSLATRREITEQLSTLAQKQSEDTIFLLSVPVSSVRGREIYESYLLLASAVSSVYNFQCGDNTVNSDICVSNASSVIAAKNNLQLLLIEPVTNEINHIIILSILACTGLILFLLFFIFFIIGLFENTSTDVNYIYYPVESPTFIPVNSSESHVYFSDDPIHSSEKLINSSKSVSYIIPVEIAKPASPFD
jgi:hypothetical protein